MSACSLCRHDRPLIFCGELTACDSCVRGAAARVVAGGVSFVREVWGDDFAAEAHETAAHEAPAADATQLDDVDDSFLARTLAETAVGFAEAGAFDRAVVAAARSLGQEDAPPEPIAVQILIGSLDKTSMARLRDALFPS